MEIAYIIAENSALTPDQLWEKTHELKLNPDLFRRKFS
jgi:hypothetical protein